MPDRPPATVILSKTSHVTFTIGFLIIVMAGVVGVAVWMTKISDDMGSIRNDMRTVAGQLQKVSDDHEVRIRELRSDMDKQLKKP